MGVKKGRTRGRYLDPLTRKEGWGRGGRRLPGKNRGKRAQGGGFTFGDGVKEIKGKFFIHVSTGWKGGKTIKRQILQKSPHLKARQIRSGAGKGGERA